MYENTPAHPVPHTNPPRSGVEGTPPYTPHSFSSQHAPATESDTVVPTIADDAEVSPPADDETLRLVSGKNASVALEDLANAAKGVSLNTGGGVKEFELLVELLLLPPSLRAGLRICSICMREILNSLRHY